MQRRLRPIPVLFTSWSLIPFFVAVLILNFALPGNESGKSLLVVYHPSTSRYGHEDQGTS